MPKKLRHTLEVILLALFLAACSSPEEKAASYMESAAQLFKEEQLNKAELEYKNALQINQNLPDAWFGLAKIHERKQEWRQTYTTLIKLRELAPGHVDGRIMLGQILLASNQIDQALTDAREIMEMVPGDARSHSLMAAVQYRLENYQGAQQEVDKALAIDPANIEALLVRARVLIVEKKYNQALDLLDKALVVNPDSVSLYLMKIQAHQQTGDNTAIETVYMALVERFPDNVSFKKLLARQYVDAGNIDSAERILAEAIEANPADVNEKLGFVDFKYQYRSIHDAIALLKTYIDSDKEEYRYRFQLGELYEKSQLPEQAKSVYQSIVVDDELQPSGLEARTRIALIELRDGHRDKASELVNEVLNHDKNNETGLLLQASFYIAEQNYDDAVLNLRTLLRDNPDSIKALGLLGQAYDANGLSELAVESYKKAFQLRPGSPVIANQLARHLVREGNTEQADEVLQESVSSGNRSLDALKLLAQVKLARGEWDQAEQLAKRLQNIEGQEALSQQVLGIVYQAKEQKQESVEAFKRAHELSPSAAQPIVSLIRIYLRDGKIEDARRFLKSVLSVDDDNLTAYLLLGRISLYEKNTPEAIEYFSKVIELEPKADVGYRSLASIYLRENDLEKAETVTRQGLAALPGRPILMINLASIYEKQRNFSKAIETYETLLARAPDLLVAKNNLASVLTDHGGDQASLDKARTIVAELKRSQIPQFRDTYAWASVKSGTNLNEAISILEGIVKEYDQVDVYTYHLGEAYRKQGDTENAAAFLKKAVALARPGTDIAARAKESLQQLN